MRLTILHTSDLHGRFDMLPRLGTLIQRERTAAHAEGRRVLLLDAGDSSAKSSPESKITGGRANFIVLDAWGCQAATLGNRDLKFGAAALQKLAAAVSFPILAANLHGLGEEESLAVPGLHSHTVLRVGETPIAIIGLTAWHGYDYTRFGYRAVNGLPRLRDLVARLRAEGLRVIILLSHLGLDLDQGVARRTHGLTAIVGGHSHTPLAAPLDVNGVPIVQAGAFGEFLGRLDLTLDDESGQLLEFDGHLIGCGPDVPADGTIAATVELVREEAARLSVASGSRG